MEPIILHVAIDSFAIQAERLRCPKLIGRPVALAPADSARPRIVAVSREALDHGVGPGIPLVVARRICRDLIALPPDLDLYSGLSDSIRDRLAPFAPFAGSPAPKAGRFVLDFTGVTATHGEACDLAWLAGREVEGLFGLHPTLGLAATRLVSEIAAGVLAPDGELLDVPTGSEPAFLAPLPVRVLPTAHRPFESARLDLLNVRSVREVQALTALQLAAAFGRAAGWSLWREAHGLDGVSDRVGEAPPTAVAEETLAAETNDRRVLAARLARLAIEVGTGIHRRGTAARRLQVGVTYVDGRHGRARRTIEPSLRAACDLEQPALALLDRAAARRVRVRRLRLEAWETLLRGEQLLLWNEAVPRSRARDVAFDRVRDRFGSGALVPASWIARGVVLRPSARP